MPTSLDDAARLAEYAAELAAEAEVELLRRVARNVARGEDVPAYLQTAVSSARVLRRDLVVELGRLDAQLSRAITSAIADAYASGVEGALEDLPGDTTVPPARAAAIRELAREATDSVRPAYAAALRSSLDAYNAAAAAAAAAITVGGETRIGASEKALARLLGRGVNSFTDRAGRNWSLESYVEMSVRTSAGRAALYGHTDTLTANGLDLVQIIPGPRSCPLCDRWAGAILSSSGTSPDHDSINDAQSAGWGHPNCRCSVGAYFAGTTRTDNVDRSAPGEYEASQVQRGIERDIRRWKKREAVALTPKEQAHTRERIRWHQAKMRAHLDANPTLKRLPARESALRPATL